MKKLTVIVGGVEIISLSICAIVLPFAVTSGTHNTSSSSSKALAVTCLLFGLFTLWCTWGLTRSGNWAHTPFFLVQIFILIAGVTLFQGSSVQVKLLSIVVFAVAILGLVGWFDLVRKPKSSETSEL